MHFHQSPPAIRACSQSDGMAKPGLVDAVLAEVRALAQGVREARRKA
jgi:hypothetical protein